ncbi:MAG: Hsp70 family protein [Polyangiaceae bacterium]|nr:Hsp70 family protein [Polyangiaceae bacterium]
MQAQAPQARRGATVALDPAVAIQPIAPARQPPPAPPQPRPVPPVLVDVTPLSLSVETVGGYCDTIITRNTPIPCDGTRIFATASNNQRVVKVRVAQGESKRFLENTVLGELELTGLREAARGEVEISVTFELDANGMLQVRARDNATGREAKARMKLIGAQDNAAADAARARQERQVVL